MVCVKGEKYALWVILRPLESMRQGKAEIRALKIGKGKANLHKSKLISVYHHLPSVSSKRLCELSNLGYIHEGGTS